MTEKASNKNKKQGRTVRHVGGDCCCDSPRCGQGSVVNAAPGCGNLPSKPLRIEEEQMVHYGKNLNLCGPLDEPYFQQRDSCSKISVGGRRRETWRTLGEPIGVVYAPVPQKSGQPNQESIRYATYLKGFALAFVTPRNEWSPDQLEKLLREGSVLFGDSQNMENPNAMIRSEVYSEAEQKVTRHFKLDNFEFMLELEPEFELTKPQPRPNTMANLRHVLKAFFKRTQFGLLWSANWYLLIWRDNGIFFVMDFNGRTLDDLKTNMDGGYPMLLVLCSVDNVAHLIRNLSGVFGSDKFILREVLVTRMVTPDGNVDERDYGPRMSEYDVITSDYAYVKSNLHLTLNPKDALRNRSALPVAVATMLASKIDHPATWDRRTYDKVMCYGVNMCQNCWEPCVDLDHPVDLDLFPRQIRMGQFVAEVLLSPNVYEGYWRCTPMYKDNDFHHILEKALTLNDYVLFQINNQMYAIWKKNDFIYLMDPYRHHIVGRILEEGEDPKSASVRMFGNLDRFLNVFHQVLLESNRSAMFHIHTLQIRNITECPADFAPPLLPPEETIEVASLNETINFGDSYEKCLDELGEISDYEEDLQSEIEPIIELTSSEEMVEEEEGGEGEAPGGEGGDEEDED